MSEKPPSFTCPRCLKTSYNPNDIATGYCGNCHEFTGEHPGITGYPQHGDPLKRTWFHQGVPMHRDVYGRPMSMHDWAVTQSDPAIRIQARVNLKTGDQVVTIWTGLWDPHTPGGGGFEVIHQRDGTVVSHDRYSTQQIALDAHRTIVERLEPGYYDDEEILP